MIGTRLERWDFRTLVDSQLSINLEEKCNRFHTRISERRDCDDILFERLYDGLYVLKSPLYLRLKRDIS